MYAYEVFERDHLPVSVISPFFRGIDAVVTLSQIIVDDNALVTSHYPMPVLLMIQQKKCKRDTFFSQ